MDQGSFRSSNGTRLLYNYDLSKSLIFLCTRRFYRTFLRNEGVQVRLQALYASHYVSISRNVSLNNGRIRHLLRRGLKVRVRNLYYHV